MKSWKRVSTRLYEGTNDAVESGSFEERFDEESEGMWENGKRDTKMRRNGRGRK